MSQNPGPGEWSQDGGAWASDQQLVGRKETSPEDRFSAKSVSPSALMDSSPVGTWAGPAVFLCSTWAILMKSHQRLVQKSPGDVSNSDTAAQQRSKRVCFRTFQNEGERNEVEREGPEELFLQVLLLGGALMEKRKLVDDSPHQAPPSHEGHWNPEDLIPD